MSVTAPSSATVAPSTAFGIDVADVLPQNWSYDAGSTSATVAGTPVADAEPTVTGDPQTRQTLSWTDLGDLPVGTQVVLTFTATPGPDVVDDPGVGRTVDHVNTASTTAEDAHGASGPADGCSYAGPSDTAVARVHSADLAIEKSHTGTPVAGAPFSWTISVDNLGPDAAVGPWTVTDTLPAQLSGATAAGAGAGGAVSPVPDTTGALSVTTDEAAGEEAGEEAVAPVYALRARGRWSETRAVARRMKGSDGVWWCLPSPRGRAHGRRRLPPPHQVRYASLDSVKPCPSEVEQVTPFVRATTHLIEPCTIVCP